MKLLDVLIQASEVFDRRGGAVGRFKQGDKVCALGALAEITLDAEVLWTIAADLLDQVAEQNFVTPTCEGQLAPSAYVNDHFGVEAVKLCYKLAIEKAREFA